MSINAIQLGEGIRHQSPGGLIAEVLMGEAPGRQIGVVHLTVPAGQQMGLHGHGTSETVLIALHGAVRLIGPNDAGDVIMLEPGALVTIPTDERVRLDNPEPEPGRLLVIFSPPEFVSKLTSWPLVDLNQIGVRPEETDVRSPSGIAS